MKTTWLRAVRGVTLCAALSCVFFSSARIASAEWSPPRVLNSNADQDNLVSDFDPRLYSDGSGGWLVLWTADNKQTMLSRSETNGQSWSQPQSLPWQYSEPPQAASDGSGHWVFCWQDLNQIWTASSADNGQSWSAPTCVSANGVTSKGYNTRPRLATDRQGHWVVAWECQANSFPALQINYPTEQNYGKDDEVFYSWSNNNGTSWSASALLNTNALTDTKLDRYVSLACNGQGEWMAVWESLNVPVYDGYSMPPPHEDGDVLCCRSTDGGQSWTTPTAILGGTTTDERKPLLTVANGTWTLVVKRYLYQPVAYYGGTYDVFKGAQLYALRSADFGQNWSTAQPMSSVSPSTTQNTADLQVLPGNSAGQWLALWTQRQPMQDSEIVCASSSDDATTWSAPVALTQNSEDDSAPKLVRAAAGQWIAAWQQNQTGTSKVVFSRSLDGGASWTAPAQVDDSASTTAFTLASDANGNCVFAWQSNESLNSTLGNDWDILFKSSSDGGANWSATAALNPNAATDQGDDNYPRLVADGQGNWVSVWQETGGNGNGDSDIFVARSSDNGNTWSTAAPLSSEALTDLGEDGLPDIATDGAGHWIAVWQSTNGSSGDFDIRYAVSTDNGATWSAPQALNTNASVDAGQDTQPRIVADRQGNWAVAWQTNNAASGTKADTDIQVAFSTNNGASWSAPWTIDGADGLNDSFADLATDGNGQWVVAWQKDETTTLSCIMAAGTPNNGASWSAAYSVTGRPSDRPYGHPCMGWDSYQSAWVVFYDGCGINSSSTWRKVNNWSPGPQWSSPVMVAFSAVPSVGTSGAKNYDIFPRAVYYRPGTYPDSQEWLVTWTATTISSKAPNEYIPAYTMAGVVSPTWFYTIGISKQVIAPGAGDRPCIASDGLGRKIIAWDNAPPEITQALGIDSDIYLSSFDGGPAASVGDWSLY